MRQLTAPTQPKPKFTDQAASLGRVVKEAGDDNNDDDDDQLHKGPSMMINNLKSGASMVFKKMTPSALKRQIKAKFRPGSIAQGLKEHFSPAAFGKRLRSVKKLNSQTIAAGVKDLGKNMGTRHATTGSAWSVYSSRVHRQVCRQDWCLLRPGAYGRE